MAGVSPALAPGETLFRMHCLATLELLIVSARSVLPRLQREESSETCENSVSDAVNQGRDLRDSPFLTSLEMMDHKVL